MPLELNSSWSSHFSFHGSPKHRKGLFEGWKIIALRLLKLEQASCVCILHLRRMIVWCCFLPSLWYYVKIRYLLGAKEKWDILALKDVKSRFTLLLLKHFFTLYSALRGILANKFSANAKSPSKDDKSIVFIHLLWGWFSILNHYFAPKVILIANFCDFMY